MNNYELYKTDLAIGAWEPEIDPETGEVLNFDYLENLQLKRSEKIEELALEWKNVTSYAAALKAEKLAFAERQKKAEAKAAAIKKYLAAALNGERFESDKAVIRCSRSSEVVTDDGFIEWAAVHAPDLLRYPAPAPDKAGIKMAIKNGCNIEHAAIVENESVVIK